MKTLVFAMLTLLLILGPTSGRGASPGRVKTKENLDPLRETLALIQTTKLVKFDLEKTVALELMGTEKVYNGSCFLSGNLFRFDIQGPDKSLVLYDGHTLWVVQYPDKAFGGPIQVSRGKLQGKQKEQLVLTELLTKGRLLESFNVKQTSDKDGVLSYEALPKNKKFNLKSVQLKIKGHELKALDYVDDIGNKTSLKILNEKLSASAKPELFHYKPEKGAQVTDL